MLPINDLLSQVKERLAIGSLSPWETSFLDSIIKQAAQGRPLTPRQAAKLAEILRTAPSKPVITYPKETL